MTLRKTFEGDFEQMELTLGTAEREFHGEKGEAALSSLDRRKEIIRRHTLCTAFITIKIILGKN